MNKIKIGLLELGHRENTDSITAIQQILDYAIESDNLGFSRFWLGEHHSPNITLPYTNPEILLTIIAGNTEKIRIGSAGTLIKMYKPYSIVSSFKLLNNLFSNRIDLGLSKGNPDTIYSRSLIQDKSNNLFNINIKKIHNLLYKEDYNFQKYEIVIPPFKGDIPELWYLSNSYKNFDDAIKLKLNFCRSIFHGVGLINNNYNKDELIKFKSDFLNYNGYNPIISLAVAININDKNKSTKKASFNTKESINYINVSIELLYETLHKYQYLYGIDEFILYDIETNNLQKIRNIENISQKFEL